MSVRAAIRAAERLLPGDPVNEGIDPRREAIMEVAEHVESEPEAVWEFIHTWGCHPHEDLRIAVATFLLEHLLEFHFTSIFPRVEQLALSEPLFGHTFLMCWIFGQSEEPDNAAKFNSLRMRLGKDFPAIGTP